MRIRNINSLVHSQQDKLVNEKKELNELNHRLDELVESLKLKKAQNDELQDRLAKIRENLLYGSGDESKYKKSLDSELESAKRELNHVSEMSTLSKIRASRSMYDLDKVREMFDDEVWVYSNFCRLCSSLSSVFSPRCAINTRLRKKSESWRISERRACTS